MAEEFEPREQLQHTLVPIRFQGEVPKFKDSFVERYKALVDDYETFIKYTLSYLNRSLRVNTLKISPEDLKKRLEKQGWKLERVPWMENGFWAENETGRRDLGNTIEHQLGFFYIQEAASMIPPLVLNPQPGETVLDCCASPGSKTTQMAEMMNNQGLLIANDLTGMRLAPLGTNVQRLGISCIVQTLYDLNRFPEDLQFDKILLDAPCSGSGTIRKSVKTIGMWNPRMICKIANTQKKLIRKVWKLLKPGGVLVYSTCSTDPEEDEEVVSEFVSEYADASLVDFELPGFKRAPAVKEWDGKTYVSDVDKTLRVWPHDNDTEGFYVAKIMKSAE